MTEKRFRYVGGEDWKEVVQLTIDGTQCEVPAGSTIAAALLAHDGRYFCQSPESKEPRSPYCLMGVCFECLVEIDGIKNRQACLERVRPGMVVKRQVNAPTDTH